MRANEFLPEIDYTPGAFPLQIDDEIAIKNAKLVGEIDGADVYELQAQEQRLLFFQSNQQLIAYIVLVDNELRAVRNISGKGGLVTALIAFVAHIEKTPIRISANEPLTPEGFRWLYKLIARGGRGLTITTTNREPIDLEQLEREWTSSMKGSAGETGLIIESHMSRRFKTKLESGPLLLPSTFFIGDEEIL